MYAIDLVLMASPVRIKPKDSSLKAACHLRYLSLSTSAAKPPRTLLVALCPPWGWDQQEQLVYSEDSLREQRKMLI